MLNSANLNDKSYEDLLAEAVSQIPLYSKEWTNFNISDPGITILENLTAFNLLQQTRINEVTDDIRRAMLKLLGYTPAQNHDAQLLVQAPGGETETVLPAQYQMWAGSLCFETREVTRLGPWGLKAVYAVEEDLWKDVTYLMDPKVGAAHLFGRRPRAGNSFCLILDGTPQPGEVMRLWIKAADETRRNPFPKEGGPVFARTRWQYYTDQGWCDVQAEDETRNLLVSGAITLTLGKQPPAVLTAPPIQGCALRCLLEESEYDRPPMVASLAANLFPASQRETKSKGYLFQGASRIEVKSALAAKGYIFVYCREKSGEPYRLYNRYAGVGEQGRYYLLEEQADGVIITFDRSRFGFGPGRGWGAVRVVCYDEEMIHHRDLGPVYGYEDQRIDLDLVQNVLPEDLSLIAETPGENGEMEYRFFSPGNTDPDNLCFSVLSREGAIHIDHPGMGMEYRLFLCDCAVTQGALGDLRAENTLIHREGLPGREVETAYTNPAPGRGGMSWEDPEALRLRFAASMREVTTAVLPSDYEMLALHTPGLCIHKVKAEINSVENLVKVVVKPYTEEKLPQLSANYLRQIGAYLDSRRMITTRVELVQPRYVPIHVSAVVYIRRHFQRAQEEVRELLAALLDHIDGEESFGGTVRFHEVYQQLIALPCVAAVDALRLSCAGAEGATQSGLDICLDEESLCYPGEFRLEFHDYVELSRS